MLALSVELCIITRLTNEKPRMADEISYLMAVVHGFLEPTHAVRSAGRDIFIGGKSMAVSKVHCFPCGALNFSKTV